MDRHEIRLEFVTTTGLYLTIHFTRGSGSARRLENVKVPWERLLMPEVRHWLDKAESKRLRQHWGADDPLGPPW